MGTLGIHHVTAISGDPQRTIDFWGGVLGMRLVKRTVNFDDPGTYHFYFGDGLGRPGTIVTFFPWGREARAGRQGTGQVAVFSLSVPPTSMGFWIQRLLAHHVAYAPLARRFDEQVLAFRDPDGMAVEIVGHERARARPAWEGGPVPGEHSVRGVHGVTLWVEDAADTVRLLEGTLGFRTVGEEGGFRRLETGEGGPGATVDVRAVAGFWKGKDGAGAVHHVAWRMRDDATELALRERLAAEGLHVTEQLDRQYFRSVYFREPGGVLFELATDAPGFTFDETAEALGESLRLPPWLEPRRAQLELTLPEIHLPGASLRDALLSPPTPDVPRDRT
ncbi:MAG: ring-cleaving dioxygenase [Gemmatimonadaceae bacterium]